MRTHVALAIALSGLSASAAVHAQVERSGNADARVMQQIQQLTSERTSLQAENTKLKEELEQLKKDLQKSGADKTAAENRAKALATTATRGEASSKQAEEQLERNKAQLQELIAKYRELTNTLRDVETDRDTTRSTLSAKERELTTCIDRNAGLYNLNAEVLDKMENRSFWSSVTEREPFTKLKRVELENLIDGYKYRADELKLEAQKAEKQARSESASNRIEASQAN